MRLPGLHGLRTPAAPKGSPNAPRSDSPIWNLAPPLGPDGPRSHLLNPYQRGALASILPVAERAVRLAVAEFAAVDAQTPPADEGEAARRRELRDKMAAFSERIDALVADYGLPTEERDWRLLLLAQLDRAQQALENAAPERLIGFGAVSPQMQAALASDIAGLQISLREMQNLVKRLGAARG